MATLSSFVASLLFSTVVVGTTVYYNNKIDESLSEVEQQIVLLDEKMEHSRILDSININLNFPPVSYDTNIDSIINSSTGKRIYISFPDDNK